MTFPIANSAAVPVGGAVIFVLGGPCRPWTLWLIDSGFNLVSFLLAGTILATWR